MKKGNPQKKATLQDNFIKYWCCSSGSHPEGWSWWKRKTRKDFRRISKKETNREFKEAIT